MPSHPDASDQSDPVVAGQHRRADGEGGQILGLMAKFWTAGQVKTRLAASIGIEAAAAIHQLFTSHLCRTLGQIADRHDLCITPEERVGEVRDTLAREKLHRCWNVIPQGKGDLGQRMTRWFAQSLADTRSIRTAADERRIENDNRAILIGADCPTLRPEDIRTAFDQLRGHDLVIGPAVDGGYYLIGMRGSWNESLASLFLDLPWGGPDVCRITCQRAAHASLSLARLRPAEDVDTIVELNHLRRDWCGQNDFAPFTDLYREIESILTKPTPPTRESSR